jgi:ATP-dependent RNA helicase RhlE
MVASRIDHVRMRRHMDFSSFGLSQSLLRAVGDEGYTVPTPIQCQAIPHVLQGRDLLACAQTGTGKTAAFALPILERFLRGKPPAGKRTPRALVLSPTRELATQIGESVAGYAAHTTLRAAAVVGGVNIGRQQRALARGVDVLIATPGRLLDLMQQRAVSFEALEVFVLDECDRMLEMGFIDDVKRITAALPRPRQTLLFSATMPDAIRRLAESWLSSPVYVSVTPVATPAQTVKQLLYYVEKPDKRQLLTRLLGDTEIDRALVFTRTKHTANRVAALLLKAGIQAAAIHGNKSQSARERALDSFKQGSLRALVATDIAARGIDIDGLGCVINYDLPNVPEAYVHRIGRTGRAGRSGQALSFCEASERPHLRSIERLTGITLAVVHEPGFSPSNVAASAPAVNTVHAAPRGGHDGASNTQGQRPRKRRPRRPGSPGGGSGGQRTQGERGRSGPPPRRVVQA